MDKENKMDNSRTVVLRRFSHPMEAEIVRSRLEAAGIPCFVGGEGGVVMQPFFNFALQGIPLFVLERDAESAKQILDENPELFADEQNP